MSSRARIAHVPLALAGCLSLVILASPAPGRGWVEMFGAGDTQGVTSIAATADGGLFAVGWVYTATGSDVWVARLDAGGNALWERYLGGSGGDDAEGLLATADGGCIVAGATTSFGAGGQDAWIVKLAANGSVEWQKTYGEAGDQYFSAIALSPDGYYAGGVTDTVATGRDLWVLELDALGSPLWQQTFAGDSDDRLRSLAATADGLILTADSNSGFSSTRVPGVPFHRPWLVKLDGGGAVQWQKTYNFSGGDAWAQILPLADGGYVAVGEILAAAFFRGDAWIVRLDAQGDVLWDERFGDNFGTTWVDSAYDVRATADGGFAVVASTGTAGAGGEDLWVLKLDAQGALEWNKTYGKETFDNGYALDLAPGGDLLIGGFLGVKGVVLRLDQDGGGTTCDLTSPTDPNNWSSALDIDAVSLAPAATAVVPAASAAVPAAPATASFLCPPPTSFCDASDGSHAACPCGNVGDPDAGCDIAQGTGGVGLQVLVQETAPLNRATLTGAGFPPASSPAAVVIRGADLDPASPVVFGDGLRCVGLPLARLGATLASGGVSVHVIGHGSAAGTGDFFYQIWFRNLPAMFCDPTAAFNLSNGRKLTW